MTGLAIKICIDCSGDFKKEAQYIFDTFFLVLGVPYELCNTASSEIDIYYGNGSKGFISIPADSYEKWIGCKPLVKWIKKTPLLYIGHEPTDLFDCDIIAASFYLLSRQEEYTDARRDAWGCFSGKYTVLRELDLLEFPIINSYIQLIKDKLHIRKPFWKDGRKFAVALTHDVDWSFKWDKRAGLRIIRPIEKGFSGLKTGMSMVFGDIYKTTLNKEDPQLSFKNWHGIENKHGFKSSFYFIALTERKGTTYDSYYIDDPKVHKLIREIRSKGGEVGIHGSYKSYRNDAKLRNERLKLEKILGDKITGLRQHYMRFDIRDTWKVQQKAGFLYDTTLGYNEALGFRAGIAFPFYPYDHKTQSKMQILELPVSIMDGVLFLEENLDATEATKRCIKLLEIVKKYNGFASLLWHPMYWDDRKYPGWRKTYENILEYLNKENAWVTSSDEIAKWWMERCNQNEKNNNVGYK